MTALQQMEGGPLLQSLPLARKRHTSVTDPNTSNVVIIVNTTDCRGTRRISHITSCIRTAPTCIGQRAWRVAQGAGAARCHRRGASKSKYVEPVWGKSFKK